MANNSDNESIIKADDLPTTQVALTDKSILERFEEDPNRDVRDTASETQKCLSDKLSFKCMKYVQIKKTNYRYYNIQDILRCSEPDTAVSVVGHYKFESGRQYLLELQTQEQIALDFSGVEEYPVADGYIEVYGVVNFGVKNVVFVRFFQHLGHDLSEIHEYLELLKNIKKLL